MNTYRIKKVVVYLIRDLFHSVVCRSTIQDRVRKWGRISVCLKSGRHLTLLSTDFVYPPVNISRSEQNLLSLQVFIPPEGPALHPSLSSSVLGLFYLKYCLMWVTRYLTCVPVVLFSEQLLHSRAARRPGGLEAIRARKGQEVGFTEDRLSVHHRALRPHLHLSF